MPRILPVPLRLHRRTAETVGDVCSPSADSHSSGSDTHRRGPRLRVTHRTPTAGKASGVPATASGKAHRHKGPWQQTVSEKSDIRKRAANTRLPGAKLHLKVAAGDAPLGRPEREGRIKSQGRIPMDEFVIPSFELPSSFVFRPSSFPRCLLRLIPRKQKECPPHDWSGHSGKDQTGRTARPGTLSRR